jgi:hypothetical protein
MDQIVTREEMRLRGAEAFDEGRGINDHDMNPGAAAIEDWQAGWRARQVAADRTFVTMLEGTPP